LDIKRIAQIPRAWFFPARRESQLLRAVKQGPVPLHIAIIMDGNGRWARRRGLPRHFGHRAGIETIRNVVRWADEIGVRILTLYAFSTENWSRPQPEVDFLMRLPVDYLETELEKIRENNIKLQVFGEMEGLPPATREAVDKAKAKTAANTGLILNLAFNYGSRTEILRAVREIARRVRQGGLNPEEVDEEELRRHLYTGDLPDPDLLIRPSGELRISNFLLWQLAYAEFWFSGTMWPDFSRREFLQAVLDFQQRDRRFGGINY
jgi:undecaprenyl diphosphate synthase